MKTVFQFEFCDQDGRYSISVHESLKGAKTALDEYIKKENRFSTRKATKAQGWKKQNVVPSEVKQQWEAWVLYTYPPTDYDKDGWEYSERFYIREVELLP